MSLVSSFLCVESQNSGPIKMLLSKWNRRLLQRVIEQDAATQVMCRIAARLPAGGISGSQLQALLEDEFPSFSPSHVGADTVKAAISKYPLLFRVEESENSLGKWCAHRRGQDDGGSSSTASSADEAYQAVQQYCTRLARQSNRSYMPLEYVLAQTGVMDVGVVEKVLRNTNNSLDVKAGLRLKAKRVPREAIVFVDGNELPPEAVNEMCNEMCLIKASSSITIVRRASVAPLSTVDVIAPDAIPTYLCIEKKVRELRLRKPDVRKDIVFMCSAFQFDTYADHVAPMNSFPDADIYICCPSKVELRVPKEVVGFDPMAAGS